MIRQSAFCAVAALVSFANGADAVSINVPSATSTGDLGDAGNAVLQGNFSDTFEARSLTWSGAITSSPNAFFFEEDVFASIEGPNGVGYTGPVAGEQGIFLGTTPFSGWSAGFTPASVNGAWRFEAYTANTFATSNNWTIQNASFTFNESLFPSADPIAVGDQISDTITEGEILWYSLNHIGGPVTFSTEGSQLSELEGNIKPNDTIVALYDDTGSLVGFDDTSGPDLTSFLSLPNLAAGDYHLAVAGSTLGTRVGPSFISTSHDAEGTIALAIGVPEPSAAMLVALATACAAVRRRFA